MLDAVFLMEVEGSGELLLGMLPMSFVSVLQQTHSGHRIKTDIRCHHDRLIITHPSKPMVFLVYVLDSSGGLSLYNLILIFHS